jgi:hypothetical protein
LKEISESSSIVDGKLYFKPAQATSTKEVSVAYFRAGYTPADYPSEKEWEARSIIEKSSAIKCPTVGYQLAGTKAIQAALLKASVLEIFLDSNESDLLRRCFARQISLGDLDTKAEATIAKSQAENDGSNWVLKPQREGGGNNYYGNNLSNFLKSHQNEQILEGRCVVH